MCIEHLFSRLFYIIMRKKISIGIYVKIGSETCHKKAPKIKVYERDNFQLEKEQVRFSANKK